MKWLNELEWIEGEVWGNIWQTECIARVSPVDGKVLGWILMDGLTQVPPRLCRLLSHAFACMVCCMSCLAPSPWPASLWLSLLDVHLVCFSDFLCL